MLFAEGAGAGRGEAEERAEVTLGQKLFFYHLLSFEHKEFGTQCIQYVHHRTISKIHGIFFAIHHLGIVPLPLKHTRQVDRLSHLYFLFY